MPKPTDNQDDKYFVKAFYDPKEKVAIASTDVVDRHGEIIEQTGWDLKNFKKNPVMLWSHDHTEIAVGNALNTKVTKASGKPQLVFTPDFHEVTDKARALKVLYEEGRLNSFSVGFIPKDMDGNTITKQELLEISAVNVPANPEARMLAYKSLKKADVKDDTIRELMPDAKVIDKLVAMEKDIKELKQAKESPSAPKTHSQVIRTRQSLVKTVAKATDKMLAGEKKGIAKDERVQYLKIIKRATEILSKSQKEQINGKNK